MSEQRKGATYGDAGVKTSGEAGLHALLRALGPVSGLRKGRAGSPALSIGYFANVVDIGRGLGLALTTDGVGTKVLVAEMLGRYDTIGIDCIAMNVNDVICVGAEPIAFLDYLAVEESRPEVLEAIGRGLAEGATQADVEIVGGELSQMGEVIRGHGAGTGVDLVGMCAGLVPLDRTNTGSEVRPGDRILGLASSGIHSNGLTLARRVLFDGAGLKPGDPLPELQRSVGETLLEPTRIYVRVLRALEEAKVPLRAMVHITGDGFLNLCRIEAPVSFRLQSLPEPLPIFQAIQRLGDVSDAEMFRVFNMGIGFCLILPPDEGVVATAIDVCREHRIDATLLGETFDDPGRKVLVEPKGLIGEGETFRKAS